MADILYVPPYTTVFIDTRGANKMKGKKKKNYSYLHSVITFPLIDDFCPPPPLSHHIF